MALHTSTQYQIVTLGEIITGKPEYGSGAKKQDFDGQVRYVRITDIDDDGKLKHDEIVSPSEIEPQYFLQEGDLLFARSGSVGRCYIHKEKDGKYQFAGYLIRFNIDRSKTIPEYIFYLTKSTKYRDWGESIKKSGTLSNINAQEYASFSFPLPPLAVQEHIVTEIDGYQKIIDGARQVVEHYHPRIEIDPAWEVVMLGEHIEFISGLSLSIPDSEMVGGTPIISMNSITEFGELVREGIREIRLPDKKNIYYLQKGDLLFNWRNGSKRLVGKTAYFDWEGDYVFASFLLGIRTKPESFTPKFLWLLLNQYRAEEKYMSFMRQNVNGLFNREELNILPVPLPDLAMQSRIVAQIEREQALVKSTRELIALFEEKIKTRIAKVWGE
ncbi:MAG: restriction endonuclease subunit S [Chloroflexi bacterium]|nr:restriction endonuclease subunit S [Chloroflexota bacterium]